MFFLKVILLFVHFASEEKVRADWGTKVRSMGYKYFIRPWVLSLSSLGKGFLYQRTFIHESRCRILWLGMKLGLDHSNLEVTLLLTRTVFSF